MVNNLVYYRMMAGLTQQEAENILFLSKGLLTKFEKGYRFPHLDVALRMATLYKCTVEDLFCLTIPNEEKERMKRMYKFNRNDYDLKQKAKYHEEKHR